MHYTVHITTVLTQDTKSDLVLFTRRVGGKTRFCTEELQRM